MDWSRPSLSSSRLPVCRLVQFDLPMRLERTEPYCKPGSSGVVESLLGSTLPDTISRGKTLAILHDYKLACMLQCIQSSDLLSGRCQTPGGMRKVVGDRWWAVGGWWYRVAKILMSVEIIVWTDASAWPQCPDFTLPYGHGVYNWKLRFCWKGRQLDIWESRSHTQI